MNKLDKKVTLSAFNLGISKTDFIVYRLGIAPATFYKFLRHEQIRTKKVRKIADYFNLSIPELMEINTEE